MDKAKIHIVFGPTASGKTDYAVQLAQKFDSVIINADSMQIYREIPIITNQPLAAEMQGIPHLLFGCRHILENSDMARWLNDAVKIINEQLEKNITPVVAGGTGMYLKALMEGVSSIPAIPQEMHNETDALLKELGNEKFHALLKEKDPVAAERLNAGDTQRMSRAYEVVEYTGIGIDEWNRQPNKKFFEEDIFEVHFLDRPREEIYDRINKRFEKFVELGAIFEAKKAREIFEQSGFTEAELLRLPAYKAHGLRELIAYLRGECSLDEAINKGQQVTRNYAKRQMTWWRNQMENKA